MASKYKIRVIGCNCLGIFDGYTRIDTLFQPYENMKRPKEGSISFITQSGTVGIIFLELLEKHGINKLISYGNRIDVDIIMVWFVFQCKPITPNVAKILRNLSLLYKNNKPIVCCAMGDDHTYKMGELIKKENIAFFYSIEEWVSAAEAISEGIN